MSGLDAEFGSAVLGGSGINEDSASHQRGRSGDVSLIVVDGATGLSERNISPGESEAQWLARTLVTELKEALESTYAVKTALATALTNVRLSPVGKTLVRAGDNLPTASIGVATASVKEVQIGCLGDVTALVKLKSGKIVEINDDRLTKLDDAVIERLLEISRIRGVPPRDARSEISSQLNHNRELANRADGYWAVDLSGSGLHEMLLTSFKTSEVLQIVLMSDGFTAGVRRGGPFDSFQAVLDAARSEELIDMLKAVKVDMLNDPDWSSIPRLSLCDDLSIASIDFSGTAAWD